ncbi:hypothetical protein AMTR_s00070p00025850 [Amborella trichopoda]|uniref:Aminotransferase-like plant mobile domain-containing protein n=1 Tax=Amborella trichopoda TaxID=13333 RepID=U5DJ02_AMBTC|nr:hypothetical protein AMTR_s00070p00025850 [Amborella trichopoda]
MVSAFGLGALSIIRPAVDDEPITCHLISDFHIFIEDNLSIFSTKGNLTTIKHSWLKANFRELLPDASLEEIVRYTRAYLLFLISVTIFADASVATVPTRLPSEEYKAWHNRVSHPIIHNVANPPIDILQPRDQEVEEVVPAREPQYIMRPEGYEDQLVSAV